MRTASKFLFTMLGVRKPTITKDGAVRGAKDVMEALEVRRAYEFFEGFRFAESYGHRPLREVGM